MTETPRADLSNWRDGPYNRWAFRNVREIMPVAAIAAAPAEPSPLPVAPVSLDGFELRLSDGSSLGIDDFRRETSSDALVVMLDGQIVYEAYDNGNEDHAPHILMSATKSVVGLILGIVAARGEIDLEALVSDYVPEVAATAYRGATIRQLADMRTGIVLEAYQQSDYQAATGWQPSAMIPDLHTFLSGLADGSEAHGGPFRYVSANTDLLGWAIERATGESFAALASALLWQPLGAEDGAYITTDGRGAARCTGGMCATARDFARLGQLVLDDGSRNGVEIVPAAWLDDIANGGDHEAWRQGEFAAAFGDRLMRYRSGWYIIDDEPKMQFAMGIHGQNLFVDRANRLVIAKLSSQDTALDNRATALTHRAVAEIRRCLIS